MAASRVMASQAITAANKEVMAASREAMVASREAMVASRAITEEATELHLPSKKRAMLAETRHLGLELGW